jgi:2,3-bisphosphoglycerate-dependent phosphoglycerate mutase
MAGQPTRRNSGRARRRRRSRAFPILGFVFVAIGLAWFFEQRATTTVIFVRNADTDAPAATEGDPPESDPLESDPPKSDPPKSDPPLNERGRRRSELLADFLQDIDVVAGVDAIYASDLKRTQQTAAPLARRLGIEVETEDPHNVETFMRDVRRRHKGKIILIVTQADAIAPLVEELHGSKKIPEIEPEEYDNVYIVSIPWFGKVKTLRVRYGLDSRLDVGHAELTGR